VPPLGLLAPTV